jgi:hypothetical protein
MYCSFYGTWQLSPYIMPYGTLTDSCAQIGIMGFFLFPTTPTVVYPIDYFQEDSEEKLCMKIQF